MLEGIMKKTFSALLFLVPVFYQDAVAQTVPSDPSKMPQFMPVATTTHAVFAADWPRDSILNHEQGTVEINYTIAMDGSVSDCTVIMGSGFQRLDDAACVMVKNRWKFKPAIRDGQPVAVSIAAKVIFALR
jgi:TonB family protein